jgi:hypothetical protein
MNRREMMEAIHKYTYPDKDFKTFMTGIENQKPSGDSGEAGRFLPDFDGEEQPIIEVNERITGKPGSLKFCGSFLHEIIHYRQYLEETKNGDSLEDRAFSWAVGNMSGRGRREQHATKSVMKWAWSLMQQLEKMCECPN